MAIPAWTDYPFPELGDWKGQEEDLRLRPCVLHAYDGNKYAIVEVEGIFRDLKIGYVYPGEAVRGWSKAQLEALELPDEDWDRLMLRVTPFSWEP